MGSRGGSFGYVPALDGMRALAVGAVLLFHGEVGVAPGGFLGVSMFFTLSGFLITTLLLVEHEATGTVALRTFFARRLRRLTPAAYLCILLVIAFGWRWNATQRQRLPGDVVASVLDVANWRFALAGTSYQDLFIGAPSPLAHFWSLAIEEQCYLLLPLLAWWGLRRGVRTFTVLVAGLLVLSITATLLTSNRDLVYYGTHTRAAELLVGVLLALALRRWSVPDRWRGAIGTAGLLAVVIVAEEGVRMLAADEQLRAATADLVAAGVPLVLFDAVPVGAAFDSGLDTIAVTMGLPQSVHRAVAGVVDSVAAGLVDGIGQNPEVVRLLVIGDSTSLEVAQALNDGSDGRLQVTWAGASGCPFVRAEATRPARDDPWRTLVCDPFDQKLPPLLDRFRPSAVLLVVSPMELVEQRYPGDPAPHVAGDAEFTAVHDAEMTAFVTMLAPYDVPLMVADSPALTPGGWATGQMTTPQRLDAWNAQVARWDAAWPQVTTFGYAGELAAFEAEHGSIRSDGVHPDVEPLTELARRSLVALLLDQLRPNSDL